MDDTRPLNGLAGESGGYHPIKRSGKAENDLEDNGGQAAYAPLPRRERRGGGEDASDSDRGGDHAPDLSDDPTPPVVEALERMRTTGAAAGDQERLRRLRGQKHYRDDPTTNFFRRLAEAEALARSQPHPPRHRIPPDGETDEHAPSDDPHEHPQDLEIAEGSTALERRRREP